MTSAWAITSAMTPRSIFIGTCLGCSAELVGYGETPQEAEVSAQAAAKAHSCQQRTGDEPVLTS